MNNKYSLEYDAKILLFVCAHKSFSHFILHGVLLLTYINRHLFFTLSGVIKPIVAAAAFPIPYIIYARARSRALPTARDSVQAGPFWACIK